MQKGIIVKGIGGFYYVDIGNAIVECRAQGHFRNKNLSPCVGDKVGIILESDTKGSISEIFERTNVFIRPPVANIDSMIIVASLKNPVPDLTFIDKMLVIAKAKSVDVTLCFNKTDLDDGLADELTQIYRGCGCKIIFTSAPDGVGVDGIRDGLKGKTTAFCGFSGVGKSSLLNSVVGLEAMQTGEVSERLKRGKHTTRHVELINYNGGYIVDTPGFSMLDFPEELTKDELWQYFPEFYDYTHLCKFRDCNHAATSKVCAVCDAAEKGDIPMSRYENYKDFYKILSQRKDWKK